MIDLSKSIQAFLFSEIQGSCQSAAQSNIDFKDLLNSACRPLLGFVFSSNPQAALSKSWAAGRRRFFPDFPPIINVYPADAADGVSNHICHIGIPGWNKILVNFIADAVKGCRCNTDKNQKLIVVFECQGFIGPVKEDAQQGIGHKMQEFVKKPHIRHVPGPGEAGLDEYGQAVQNWRQPVKEKYSQL